MEKFQEQYRSLIFPICCLILISFVYQNCGNSRLGFRSNEASQLDNNFGQDINNDLDSDGLNLGEEIDLGTNPNSRDTDGDGLSDGAEVDTHGTDPKNPDTDGGGVGDGVEVTIGTDPLNPADDQVNSNLDNDGDGLTDDDETNIHNTDPNRADTDGDGLNDGEEVNTHGTNPLDPDTDDGGVTDGAEVTRGTDPLDKEDDFPAPSDDPDEDGLSNAKEVEIGTNPLDPDTDGDGLKDGAEVNTHGTNPLDRDTDDGGIEDGPEVGRGTDPLDKSDDLPPIDPNLDTDQDGLTDLDETNIHGSDPLKPDTDGDGLKDGEEVNTHGTSPIDPDSDDGGVTDGFEVGRGTNPLNPTDDFPVILVDSDQDGLTDDVEVTLGTNPLDPDTDKDMLTDGAEHLTHNTNPLKKDTDDGGVPDGIEVTVGADPLDPSDDPNLFGNGDTDGDGLTDAFEDELGTDKTNPDTDGDGLKDGEEVNTYGTSPLLEDTDTGKLNDGDEVIQGLNPLDKSDDYLWSDWTDFKDTSSCSDAGVKSQERTRTCLFGQCIGSDTEIRTNVACTPPPVDGQWSDWVYSDWSDKAYSCGTRAKTRSCDNPAPRHGGKACEGDSQGFEEKTCPGRAKVDDWGLWEKVGTCSGGKQKYTRQRIIKNYKGSQFVDQETQTEHKYESCYVWNTWGPYKDITACGYNGTKQQQRTRTCKTGNCPRGDATQNKSVRCPAKVDGKWNNYGPWGPWSDKAYSCGTRSRKRTCTPPKNGGKACVGSDSAVEGKSCETRISYGNWTKWKNKGLCVGAKQKQERTRKARIYSGSTYLRTEDRKATKEVSCTRYVEVATEVSPATACARIKMHPIGCASAERRPSGTKINFTRYSNESKLGGWGTIVFHGYKKGRHYCYGPGQKQNYEKADRVVAYNCGARKTLKIKKYTRPTFGNESGEGRDTNNDGTADNDGDPDTGNGE